MTEKEIKKALECCSKRATWEDCPIECPMYQFDGDCFDLMQKDILDLINRLELESDNYQRIAENQQSLSMKRHFEIKRLNEEIERLNKEVDQLSQNVLYNDGIVSDLEKDLFNAKTEAVKEFVKAYKDQIKNYTGMFTDEGFYVSLDAVLSAVDFVLNKTLEEMVGEG